MLYKWLPELVSHAADVGVEKIAISTNGSASLRRYEDLIARGVNDFSISLDACCGSFGSMRLRGKMDYHTAN